MLKEIESFFNEKGRVPNVSELSRILGVTRNTVYNRLKKLEDQGIISKCEVIISAGYELKKK